MLAPESPVVGVFRDSLHRALAKGVRPPHAQGLGEKTYSALEAIALEHPDATADHIADAFDAFGREHPDAG
ncbi:hypothetical protein [Mycolicibacterium lacusdiani]|uniref:hypothetical protein n=1 Tax=Mycolicibacterium lacusdiani TaxID=2895283 RepID=UPI001F35A3EF|nr:hypothetical protein [Mycolicibacterium lacusdiani]